MNTIAQPLQASHEAIAFTLEPRPVVRTYRSLRRIAQVADSVRHDLAHVLRTSPASLLDGGELLRSNGARRTVRVCWDGQTYVLKHYVEPTWRHALKQTIQSARARTTWSFTHRLANAGVSTPRPVACIENCWGVLRLDSYLMYPYIEGCTLRAYFTGKTDAPASARDRVWQQLDALWQRLVELRV